MPLPSLFEPIHIPDWAWQRPETRQLLSDRDIAALFRFAQQYGGVSQSRIAAATGLAQGRVNEIANGRRAVTNLEVLLRIADGLHMPDDARVTMGLAPARPAGNDLAAMSGEISRVYPNQAPVAEEIRRRAVDAQQLDVLAVRGLGILGLNDSLLRPALMARTTPLLVRVLLLAPDCPAAERRAGEISESMATFSSGIRLALARLEEVAAANHVVDLAVRLYARLPVWRIIRLDDVAYVSAFDAAWEGHESAVYEIPHTPRGAFWAGFSRLFDDVWDNAHPVIGGEQ